MPRDLRIILGGGFICLLIICAVFASWLSPFDPLEQDLLTATAPPMSESQLVARLRQIGEERYHHKHPFHLLMHEGKLTRGQLQAWALNRYCYQSHIPIKDAIIRT